jgi:hypothetical protein
MEPNDQLEFHLGGCKDDHVKWKEHEYEREAEFFVRFPREDKVDI